MKKINECKIVQDLLPSYIDKITDKTTNKFIEEHISQCDECRKALEEMGESVLLDKVDERKKINYLKKIKMKNRFLLSITFTIMFIIIVIIINFYNSAIIYTDKTGHIKYAESFIEWISNGNKNDIITSQVTNMLVVTNEKSIKTGNDVKTTIILTFNKKDICIGSRYCVDGFSREELEDRVKKETDMKITALTDMQIKDDKLIYSYNYWNGKTREYIENQLCNNIENQFTVESVIDF